MTTAIFDFDIFKYKAASAGEKRTIHAIHNISGDEFKCKTRTQLYGHHLKKEGGLLAEFNKANNKDYRAEDFKIVDIQNPEPVQNILHTVKIMIESSLYALGTTKYNGYLGKGDSFRVERSTLLKYKGGRDNTLRPLLLDDVTEYISKKYKAETVTGLESDDWCTIDAYRDKSKVVVTSDKDAMGTDCLVYNPFAQDGVIDCSGLGSLWLDGKGKVRGKGRLFFYFQVACGDSADDYKANCFSDIDWGEKSAYKVLKDCKTDEEALKAVVDCYKHLYPESKTIIGWRNDEFEITWDYVFDELWDMARMLRTPTDRVVGTDVLRKFNLL